MAKFMGQILNVSGYNLPRAQVANQAANNLAKLALEHSALADGFLL